MSKDTTYPSLNDGINRRGKKRRERQGFFHRFLRFCLYTLSVVAVTGIVLSPLLFSLLTDETSKKSGIHSGLMLPDQTGVFPSPVSDISGTIKMPLSQSNEELLNSYGLYLNSDDTEAASDEEEETEESEPEVQEKMNADAEENNTEAAAPDKSDVLQHIKISLQNSRKEDVIPPAETVVLPTEDDQNTEESAAADLYSGETLYSFDSSYIAGSDIWLDPDAPPVPAYEKEGTIISLSENMKSLIVKSGEIIYLELNGHIINNQNKYEPAVQIEKGGRLIIAGSGMISNASGMSAVINEGECCITDSVLIYNDTEEATIENTGIMEISGLVTVTKADSGGVLIENNAELSIWSGYFFGGEETVLEGEEAVTRIYGGKYNTGVSVSLTNTED